MFMMYRKQHQIEEVNLSDCFTNADAIKVKHELEFIICRGSSKVLLDISELTSIEKNAVSLIYYCSQLCSKRNGQAIILNPTKSIMRILDASLSDFSLSYCFDRSLAMEKLGA